MFEKFPENKKEDILFKDLIKKVKQMPEDEKKLFNLENLEKNEGEHFAIMTDRLKNSFEKLRYELELKYGRSLSDEEMKEEKDIILSKISKIKSIDIKTDNLLLSSGYNNYNNELEIFVGVKDITSKEIRNITACHEIGHYLRDDLYNVGYNNPLYKKIIDPFYLKHIDFEKIWDDYMNLVKQITIDNGEMISEQIKKQSDEVEKNLDRKILNLYKKNIEYAVKNNFFKKGDKNIQTILDYWFNLKEVVERMAQMKNFFGMGSDDIFTKKHLDFFKKNYSNFFKNKEEREFAEIQIAQVLYLIENEDKFIENMNKMWI